MVYREADLSKASLHVAALPVGGLEGVDALGRISLWVVRAELRIVRSDIAGDGHHAGCMAGGFRRVMPCLLVGGV